MDAPGKKLLRGGGVLFVLAGMISATLAIISLATVGTEYLKLDIAMIVAGVYQAVVGILGIKHCNTLEKGRLLHVLAVIVLPLYFAAGLLDEYGDDFFLIILLLFGFFIPALVIRGAYLNNRALKRNRSAAQ